MRRPLHAFLICALCVLALLAVPPRPLAADLTFPALTGRVVDDAGILRGDTVDALTAMLAEYEKETGDQVVIVTLSSLQGHDIEDYGYKLGRHWAIGQKGKNNGVLLIVAPEERKVRIEVGYGLEPMLTDAAASTIIHSIILPAFTAGDLDKGVLEGAQALIEVLGPPAKPQDDGSRLGKGAKGAEPAPLTDEEKKGLQLIAPLIMFVLWMWLAIRHPVAAQVIYDIFLLSASISRSSSYRSGGGGRGFSGGGGTFGGGGASGSW